jgi:hypothetical protein
MEGKLRWHSDVTLNHIAKQGKATGAYWPGHFPGRRRRGHRTEPNMPAISPGLNRLPHQPRRRPRTSGSAETFRATVHAHESSVTIKIHQRDSIRRHERGTHGLTFVTGCAPNLSKSSPYPYWRSCDKTIRTVGARISGFA